MFRSENKSFTIQAMRGGAVALAVAGLLALAACGAKKEEASQVAAKVNDDEITVHEIDFALSQQRNLRPDQVDAASHQLLERLIDQQLAVQKAVDAKLDRDPTTLQMIEAARREILARRYVESQGDKLAKPTDADIQKYFAAKPALFSERKIYAFQRTDVQVPPERRAEAIAQGDNAKSGAEVADWAKSQGMKFNVSSVTIPAEGLPLQVVDRANTLKEGQSMALPQQFGESVLTLVSAQSAPKTFEESRAAISQFLQAEANRTAVAELGKTLRQGAKIEYKGKFAASAPATGGADASAPTAPAVADTAAPAPAPAPAVAQTASAASSPAGMDAATVQKGMGLK